MLLNRESINIYGSTDLRIYWVTPDKLRMFYRYISHDLCAKRVRLSMMQLSKTSSITVARQCNNLGSVVIQFFERKALFTKISKSKMQIQ